MSLHLSKNYFCMLSYFGHHFGPISFTTEYFSTLSRNFNITVQLRQVHPLIIAGTVIFTVSTLMQKRRTSVRYVGRFVLKLINLGI